MKKLIVLVLLILSSNSQAADGLGLDSVPKPIERKIIYGSPIGPYTDSKTVGDYKTTITITGLPQSGYFIAVVTSTKVENSSRYLIHTREIRWQKP